MVQSNRNLLWRSDHGPVEKGNRLVYCEDVPRFLLVGRWRSSRIIFNWFCRTSTTDDTSVMKKVFVWIFSCLFSVCVFAATCYESGTKTACGPYTQNVMITCGVIPPDIAMCTVTYPGFNVSDCRPAPNGTFDSVDSNTNFCGWNMRWFTVVGTCCGGAVTGQWRWVIDWYTVKNCRGQC